MPEILVRRYCTVGGAEPFTEWFAGLKDRKAHARILARIEVLALGSLGDAKALRDGVWELRIDVGPGYRVYFGREGNAVVILLCGGDKSTQAKDIEQAKALLAELGETDG